MRRFHLFEFEDLRWWPHTFRNLMTDFLQYLMSHYEVYDSVLPLLKRMLSHSNEDRVLDLCSGGSGPWIALYKQFDLNGTQPFVTLSDKYPNLPRFQNIAEQTQGRIAYLAESIDAVQVPDHLDGIRTIFTAFHHFRPEQARAVLQKAAHQGKVICVFEDTERTWGNVIFMFLMTPFFVWFLVTPFIRPITFTRLFWTYIIPVVPFALMWDAMVSEIRSYSPTELKAMTDAIAIKDYTWEIGEQFSPPLKLKITYLLGYPNADNQKLVADSR